MLVAFLHSHGQVQDITGDAVKHTDLLTLSWLSLMFLETGMVKQKAVTGDCNVKLHHWTQ